MEKLIKFYDDLTNSEKEIFDYIFNHQDEVKNMKIMDLAKKILVSKTLIINMTQKLGFSGYTDFKYYLKSGNIPKIKKDEYESIQSNLKEDIEKTFSLVNTKEIKNIVREIQKVKTIYVVARGTSKSVGSHLNHLLLTLGFRCIFLEDYNLITNVAKTLESNELVILISLSGKTDKVLEIAGTVFDNIPLLFAMGVAYGLSKKDKGSCFCICFKLFSFNSINECVFTSKWEYGRLSCNESNGINKNIRNTNVKYKCNGWNFN